jgi:hypothetical protein
MYTWRVPSTVSSTLPRNTQKISNFFQLGLGETPFCPVFGLWLALQSGILTGVGFVERDKRVHFVPFWQVFMQIKGTLGN